MEIDDLIVKLENIKNIDLSKGLNKAGQYITEMAQAQCPVDTGTLRRSIKYRVEDNSAIIGTNIEYAPCVHEGTGLYAYGGQGRPATAEHPIPWRYQSEDGKWHTTSGQKPKPFLQNALLQNKDIVKEIIENSVKEELDARH